MGDKFFFCHTGKKQLFGSHLRAVSLGRNDLNICRLSCVIVKSVWKEIWVCFTEIQYFNNYIFQVCKNAIKS